MNEPLYYSDYLGLDDLLSLQRLESARQGDPAHDEMLFMIVHQAYELWFKQILFELESVLEVFKKDPVDDHDMGRVVLRLGRVVEIERLMLVQLDVLETMTPLDFLDFRDYLIPASGFQSFQFRLIENLLGISPAERLKVDGAPYTARLSDAHADLLERSEEAPSILDCVGDWLERTPFLHFGAYDFWEEYRTAVRAMVERDRRLIDTNPNLGEEEKKEQLRAFDETIEHYRAVFDIERYEKLKTSGRRKISHEAFLAALLINLYRDEPILQLPFRLLSRLMDIDEGLTAWRYRHALMVRRMIGTKIGTGGTAGFDYLRAAAEQHRVFSDFFDVSTFLLPRSALPQLPAEVREKMAFNLDVAAR